MKAKAAIAWQANEPLSVEEIDVTGPRDNEVLVRVKATGVCHTDAYTLSGKDPEGQFPAILGHEGAGVIEDVGKDVTSLKPGDHVVPAYVPECGECRFCRSNKTNLCQAIRQTQGQGVMPDGSSRFSKNGQPLYHFMGTSTFSNYTVLPEIAVAKISDDAPLDKVCLLGCAIPTGVGAVMNNAQVEPGSTVAVFGLGAVGLSVVQGAKMANAERIIAIDINPDKYDLARRFGATDCINPNDNDAPIKDVIIDETGGGADYTFECIGNVNIMRQALEAAHKGWGESVIIGVAGKGEEIATRPVQLVTGRTWKGSAFGGVKSRTQIPQFVDWYMNDKLPIDDFVTHTRSIDDINEAFELMENGESVRTVVYHDQ